MSRKVDLLRATGRVRDREQRRRVLAALYDAFLDPPRFRPGHYHSPMQSSDDIDRALSWTPEAPGVDLNDQHQLSLFGELMPLWDSPPPRRYEPTNNWYYPPDAAVYRALLRRLNPRRVVEVGSGFSTAVLLDTAERYLPGVQVTCIEPNPGRLLGVLRDGDDVEVIRGLVQDAPLDVFTSLTESDILFVDSSHVAKAGSDVLWLVLHVLPRLKPGVVVHFHDVFWPFQYPADWMRMGRNLNEVYIVHAFLCHNAEWRIELFNSWIWQAHPEVVPPELVAVPGREPSSLWMSRR